MKSGTQIIEEAMMFYLEPETDDPEAKTHWTIGSYSLDSVEVDHNNQKYEIDFLDRGGNKHHLSVNKEEFDRYINKIKLED
jgi:hypothetical protein